MTEPVDDGFDAWLGGATVSKRSVPIYGKPGLYADWQRLEKDRERIEDEAGEEPSLGDSRLEEIESQQRALYDEWVASKSTWTVRALSETDLKAIRDTAKAPEEPGKDASDDERRAYAEATAEHNAEVNLLIVQRAVESIDFGGKVAKGITLERLRSMREKLGNRQIDALVAAAQAATVEEPEIPFPSSRSVSQDDET